jgi:hypothetical protein
VVEGDKPQTTLHAVSLLREPSDWRRPERDRAVGTGTHRNVTRRAAQQIGRGSLACPSCDLPLLPVRVGISDPIACPFCGHAQAARGFLRLGESDTARNEVHLIARLP